MAERERADLILGTDPDCDRVGVLARNKDKKLTLLTGNQIGALLVNYILKTLKEKNRLPNNAVIIKTIVTNGMALCDALLSLYEEYGYFFEDTNSIALERKVGLEKINIKMDRFRNNPPNSIAGYSVVKIEDYLNQNHLPQENVLKIILEGNRWIALRPSGTEPRFKIYCGVVEKSLEKAEKEIEALISNSKYIWNI